MEFACDLRYWVVVEIEVFEIERKCLQVQIFALAHENIVGVFFK